MTARVIALDPGGTTGWAMWQDEPIPGTLRGSAWEHFTCGQMGPEPHHLDLYNFLGHMHTQVYSVVCESFEFRKGDEHRAGVSLISREYIGVARLFAQERLGQVGQTLVMQTAGAAKGFIPDKPRGGLEANAKLKVLGLYVPGKQHANDAMRHLIYYLVNRRGMVNLIQPWKELT